MSGRVKVPSLEEIKAKRKAKKTKLASSSGAELKVENTPAPVPTSKEVIQSAADSRKRKAVDEPEEDLQNVLVKIPHGTSIFADPSGLDPYVRRLLLEEDEGRLTELGPVEASRRAVVHAYQTLECTLFQQRTIEANQRRLKDLERSNAELRKELIISKQSSKESEQRAVAAESTLMVEREMSQLEVASLKEAVGSLESQVKSLEGEKADLVEQVEGVAYEAMLKERAALMKQYKTGEHVDWSPARWIRAYERLEAGLSSEDDCEEIFDDQPTAVEGIDASKTAEEPAPAPAEAAVEEPHELCGGTEIADADSVLEQEAPVETILGDV